MRRRGASWGGGVKGGVGGEVVPLGGGEGEGLVVGLLLRGGCEVVVGGLGEGGELRGRDGCFGGGGGSGGGFSACVGGLGVSDGGLSGLQAGVFVDVVEDGGGGGADVGGHLWDGGCRDGGVARGYPGTAEEEHKEEAGGGGFVVVFAGGRLLFLGDDGEG